MLRPHGQYLLVTFNRLELNSVPKAAQDAVSALFSNEPLDYMERGPFCYTDPARIRQSQDAAPTRERPPRPCDTLYAAEFAKRIYAERAFAVRMPQLDFLVSDIRGVDRKFTHGTLWLNCSELTGGSRDQVQ